ncbi:MAG: phenylalanine--tRNA ligase subunit beta [Rubellimicrobium sp.]|nr:phenylalanine--tRNA ligase subunit beta [Rubellimicrobium sp.]
MKFTLSWLGDHLETTATLDEIVEALTDLGLEVEEVTNPAARLGAFTLAHVLEAHPHPDAERLRVCRVLTDEGERQIVCGAPNARAGIVAVLAKPGDYVPGIDVTLGVSKIRGVESHGMMCSERELEMSDEHDGIVELPSGAVGERFIDWLAANDPARVDPVIEIAITPNRPDALAVRGIARDLAARGLGRLKPAPDVIVPATVAGTAGVSIDADTLDGCPLFCLREIRGVRNGPSPEWLQQRLRAIGLRPINFLVDVTNFFSHDRARPLHVFDADKVRGNLRVHRALGGETVLALDGRTYTFQPGQMVIADDSGALAIGGIMGGEETGCSEATVNVLVESAWWEPVTVARTGRALKLTSDARYRFERGVDPAWTAPGLELATRMILDHAGGAAAPMVVAGAMPDTARAYRFDPAAVERIVGMSIPAAAQAATLTALGFEVRDGMAHVPSWRPDVQGDADIVEEVARVASLGRLEGQPLPRPEGVTRPVLTPPQARRTAARRVAAALGYNECVSYSFVDRRAAELFGGGSDATMLENPISSEMSHMRPSLLPGLLRAAARNQARGFMDMALFEAGSVFSGGEPGEQAFEVAGLLVGRQAPRDVHGGQRPVDIFDARADAEAVLAAAGAPHKMMIRRGAPGFWHPGRHGILGLGPKVAMGIFGEVHPRILAALDVKGPAVAFTLWPDVIPLPRKQGATRGALELSDLQPVERDFAFLVDARVESGAIVTAAQGADKALITEVRVFDQFAGTGLGEGRKSVAITVRLEPRTATLTEAEIEAVCARVVDKVTRATGATLRS